MKEFLKKNNLDFIIINSTNKFLVEYNVLQENSRYHLTEFTGSTGDVLASSSDIFLFVDGRYHEQADRECDLSKITVVKLQPTQKFIDEVAARIKPNSVLGIISEKTSFFRYENLKKVLNKKQVKVKLLEIDPFEQNSELKPKSLTTIPLEICGKSCDEKLIEIANTLSDNDAYLFTNLEEVSYLCNLRDFNKENSTSINGKLLISKNWSYLFFDDNVQNFSNKIEKLPLSEFKNKLTNLKTIFYDKTSTNMRDFSLIKSHAKPIIKNPLSAMKSIKTNEEIEHYIDCFNRTDKAVFTIRNFINNNDNISEQDISDRLEQEFLNYGAKSLSFKSIVAKDKNSALAHYSKNSETEILKDGSLVLIDCGGYYEGGYATDITRVFVKGTPTEEQRKIYTLVLKAFLNAFNTLIEPLTTGYDVDKVARDLLDKIAPLEFEFSHGLGHGIGISVHESPPRLSSMDSSKTILKENMCFTIEPGLYFKNFGGVRLENSVYIKNGKIKSFSNMCYEKKLIDYSLLSEKENLWLREFEVL